MKREEFLKTVAGVIAATSLPAIGRANSQVPLPSPWPTVETSTSPDASPTDAWGSSAMLYALMEGLAGVEDRYKLYNKVRLAPRWVAAGRTEAEVSCVYSGSGAAFSYSYNHDTAAQFIELELNGNAEVELHVLLPKGKKTKRIVQNAKALNHRTVKVEESPYADARLVVKNKAAVRVSYS